MPPSPLYNWLCVLHSASEIISHAATIRAGQIARANRELGRGFERPGVVGGRTLVEEQYVKGRRVDGKEPAAEKRVAGQETGATDAAPAESQMFEQFVALS